MRHECIASLFVLADLATAAVARTDIDCIDDAPLPNPSSTMKSVSFWVDDASKTTTSLIVPSRSLMARL